MTLLNWGGIMIDPLSVPYIQDVVQAGVGMFGWMMTVQAVGRVFGCLFAARIRQRFSMVAIYGWLEGVLGLILIARYNIPNLRILFVTTLITGFPAALGLSNLGSIRNCPHEGTLISAAAGIRLGDPV